ncbi:MAG: Mov34/MPN/PAD-1 family protein [bacterium]
MWPKKKNKRTKSGKKKSQKQKQTPDPGAGAVAVGEWQEVTQKSSQPFPVPGTQSAQLRVFFEKQAYASVVAHARSSLDAEICGVLLGVVGEDEDGDHVQVKAVIEGEGAKEGSTHVTFTQETWNKIHHTRDNEYPDMQIVGWYHSHPGFGVQFSEMDLFIQRNFFSSPTQVALVTDPVIGEVAICANAEHGIAALRHFWVGGKEMRCQTPPSQDNPQPREEALSEEIRALESKLDQLMHNVESHRNGLHLFVMFVVVLVLVVVVAWAGHWIYFQYTTNPVVPRIESLRSVPIPVRIGDKTVFLTVQIVGLEVPVEKDKKETPSDKREGQKP